MSRTAAVCLLLLLAAGVHARPPGAPGLPDEAGPDLLFYAEKVSPEVQERCAGCHADPESAGGFLLRPQVRDREALLANYRAAVRFVDGRRPAESKLLLKALGQLNHGGGAVYPSVARKDYELLLDFALGGTMRNRPPDAIVTRRFDSPIGQPLELDGTLSGDRDSDRIAYRWTLLARPEGSTAALEGVDREIAHLVPDQPGLYRLELSVHDGRLWSQPAPVSILATAGGTSERPAPTVTAPARGTLGERRLDAARLRMIRRLYMDLLWRSPTLEEIGRWYDRTQEETVAGLLALEETWTAWYEAQLYYFLLLDQFRPKEGPIPAIPARLARGEITPVRALEEIVRSQYFNARNPGNDTFVTVVLEQCLGLTVQDPKNRPILEAGKKMYDGYRQRLLREEGDSQADFVRIVFSQEAFYDHLLRRTWKAIHGAEADKAQLTADRARLMQEPGAFGKILAVWLNGPAYAMAAAEPRTKPEVPYVRALFLDTLGRLPSYEELRNVRNAFLSMADPTPVRLVMGRVLLEASGAASAAEARDERFVVEQFVRLLARPPTDAEREAFAKALREDPQVTPRIVIWTLLSSAEYQAY